MQTLSDLKERTQWAIDYISEKYSLTVTDIGKAVGSKPDTVSKYRSKLSTPRISFLVKFCGIYGMDFKWMSKGIGQPFPEKLAQFPKSTTPDGPIKTERNTYPISDEYRPQNDNTGSRIRTMPELLQMAEDILRSNTLQSRILANSIVSLREASQRKDALPIFGAKAIKP
jgi:hypothetical protein